MSEKLELSYNKTLKLKNIVYRDICVTDYESQESVFDLIVTQLENQISGVESDSGGDNKKEDEKKDLLQNGIRISDNDEIVIPGEGFDAIEKDFLMYTKKNSCCIKIDYPDYILEIDSANINNPNHSFTPQIDLSNDGDNILLNVNGGNKIPGKIKIYLKNSLRNMKYLYFQNERTDKYEMIALDNKEHSFDIDDGGTYILTNGKLNSFKIDRKILITATVIFVCVLFFYYYKKKTLVLVELPLTIMMKFS